MHALESRLFSPASTDGIKYRKRKVGFTAEQVSDARCLKQKAVTRNGCGLIITLEYDYYGSSTAMPGHMHAAQLFEEIYSQEP